MSRSGKLRLYFVIGEMSGDALGADLMEAFARHGQSVEPLGLGGEKMAAHGLSSLFPCSEIAVMGLSGVIAGLPGLLARVRRVANDIIEKRPDAILLIDSPDFGKQVAKRVKRRMGDIPVIKYVCPSVWAWRPGRARKMRAYLDHVLAILPFEPDVLAELDGPPATYVGHPLSRFAGKTDLKARRIPADPAQVLLMPGSRKSETDRLLPILRDTAALLAERGHNPRFVLPAVPHLYEAISAAVEDWPVKPELVDGEEAKIAAMQSGDAAIAASGTAILELAMHGVPSVSIYKPDPAVNALRFLIKAWTGALPNLIADKVIVPERINEFAHPGYIARLVEPLLTDSHERRAQLEGFALVHERMKQDRPTGDIAVEAILSVLGKYSSDQRSSTGT